MRTKWKVDNKAINSLLYNNTRKNEKRIKGNNISRLTI